MNSPNTKGSIDKEETQNQSMGNIISILGVPNSRRINPYSDGDAMTILAALVSKVDMATKGSKIRMTSVESRMLRLEINVMRNHTIVVFERLCTSFAFLLNNSLLEFMSRISSLDSSGVPICSDKGCHKGYINHPGTLCSPTTRELLKKKAFSEFIYVNKDSVNKHTLSQIYSCFNKSKRESR